MIPQAGDGPPSPRPFRCPRRPRIGPALPGPWDTARPSWRFQVADPRRRRAGVAGLATTFLQLLWGLCSQDAPHRRGSGPRSKTAAAPARSSGFRSADRLRTTGPTQDCHPEPALIQAGEGSPTLCAARPSPATRSCAGIRLELRQSLSGRQSSATVPALQCLRQSLRFVCSRLLLAPHARRLNVVAPPLISAVRPTQPSRREASAASAYKAAVSSRTTV